jgi:hypothetical protein
VDDGSSGPELSKLWRRFSGPGVADEKEKGKRKKEEKRAQRLARDNASELTTRASLASCLVNSTRRKLRVFSILEFHGCHLSFLVCLKGCLFSFLAFSAPTPLLRFGLP